MSVKSRVRKFIYVLLLIPVITRTGPGHCMAWYLEPLDNSCVFGKIDYLANAGGPTIGAYVHKGS